MSRHTIRGIDPKLEVVVGYDRPMRTLFGQVFNNAATLDEEEVIAQTGLRFDEVQTVDALAAFLAPHAVIPPRVKAVLEDEMANKAGANVMTHDLHQNL